MHATKPKVFKIAETTIDEGKMRAMLIHLGGLSDQMDDVINYQPPAEALTEIAGRICYKSFAPGLNPNVTKIRADSKDYIMNTLGKGDGSIFEHASVTFAFLDVSRVFTHELVRHRVGVAISQESMRYVRITDIGMGLPDALPAVVKDAIVEATQEAEKHYQKAAGAIPWDKLTMTEKKAVTSGLRRMIPDGISTNIIWTTNHRNLRHVLEMRTDPAAEIEIREVFNEVGKIVQREYPMIYGDFQELPNDDGIPWWKPAIRSKV